MFKTARDLSVDLVLFPNGKGYLQQVGPPSYLGRAIRKTSDFGDSWRKIPGTRLLHNLSFATPRVGYASVLDEDTVFYGGEPDFARTLNGGRTWTNHQFPTPDLQGKDSASFNGWSLQAPSLGKFIVAGTVGRSDGCTPVFRVAVAISTDRGESFEFSEQDFDGHVHRFEMLDAQHGAMVVREWAAGVDPISCSYQATSAANRVMVTHDGGHTWITVRRDPFQWSHPDDDDINEVSMPSPDRLVLGTMGGDILTSHDGGRTFTRATGTRNPVHPGDDPHGLERIEYIDFADEAVGYAISPHGALWRTRDGGLTWARERTPQSAGESAWSTALAVADRRYALISAHELVSSRWVP